MAARPPVASTNRQAASTLGPIDPAANRQTPQLGRRGHAQRPRPRRAPVQLHGRDVDEQKQEVGVQAAGEQGGGQVLVDHRLHPVDAAGLDHHRDTTTAGAHHQHPGLDQEPDGGQLANVQGLGAGHGPPPQRPSTATLQPRSAARRRASASQ